MAWKTIEANVFSKQLIDVLKDFADVEVSVLDEECEKVSKEALKMIKEKSPKSHKKQDTRSYAAGWKRMKNKGNSEFEYTLYNASKPGLTHLLEKGHKVKPDPTHPNRKSFVEGIEHIGPTEEWAASELIKRVERKL